MKHSKDMRMIHKIVKDPLKLLWMPLAWKCKIYFSVSNAEIVVIAEGNAEHLAAIEMVVASSGATTGYEAIEIIDRKSMTAAMETANKVISAHQAPNK